MGNDSGIPPRDDADRKYSRDDVEHLVAREVAMIQGGFKIWDSASASHVTAQHYQQPSKQ